MFVRDSCIGRIGLDRMLHGVLDCALHAVLEYDAGFNSLRLAVVVRHNGSVFRYHGLELIAVSWRSIPWSRCPPALVHRLA